MVYFTRNCTKLRESNVFSHVCLSFCPQEKGPCRGSWLQPSTLCIVPPTPPPPHPDTFKLVHYEAMTVGRFTFNWNAFFLICQSKFLPAATKLVHGGVSNFSGGGGWVSNFSGGGGSNLGGSPIFRGVSKFFFSQFPPPKFFWDAPPRDGQCAAGTHPTGMHSCFLC